jgi:hypothetical protein
MKNAYLLLLLCFIAQVCGAQERPIVILNNQFKDTNNYQSNGSMPNALKKNDPKLSMKLKGNNQQGFDVYESPLDKMPILSPDSANKSSLGMNQLKAKNKTIIITPQSFDYSQIPLTRPFDDSLLIPDFNQKPFSLKREQQKKSFN